MELNNFYNVLNSKESTHNPKFDNIAEKNFHVKEFLPYENETFITNSYKALLKRSPDEEGLKHYSRKLKNTNSKLRILRELVSSDEAKLSSVRVQGLYKVKVWERIIYSAPWMLCKKFFSILLFFPQIIKKSKNNLRHQIRDCEAQINNLNQKIYNLQSKLKDQDQLVSNLLLENSLSIEQSLPDWNNFYVELENKFRGSKKIIKTRLNSYLPFLKNLKELDKFPILDIGCGRGEWLELLKENNLNAIGIDCNAAMVEHCKEHHLTAINDDIFIYLDKQPANSFNAITGFQIIEHLSFPNILRLIQETVRTLKDGGILILETPNPFNVKVSSWSFYMDPTHKKPLPAELMEFIFSYFGLQNIHIIPLNTPADRDSYKIDGHNEHYLNLLYGPQDYAIVGYK